MHASRLVCGVDGGARQTENRQETGLTRQQGPHRMKIFLRSIVNNDDGVIEAHICEVRETRLCFCRATSQIIWTLV